MSPAISRASSGAIPAWTIDPSALARPVTSADLSAVKSSSRSGASSFNRSSGRIASAVG